MDHSAHISSRIVLHRWQLWSHDPDEDDRHCHQAHDHDRDGPHVRVREDGWHPTRVRLHDGTTIGTVPDPKGQLGRLRLCVKATRRMLVEVRGQRSIVLAHVGRFTALRCPGRIAGAVARVRVGRCARRLRDRGWLETVVLAHGAHDARGSGHGRDRAGAGGGRGAVVAHETRLTDALRSGRFQRAVLAPGAHELPSSTLSRSSAVPVEPTRSVRFRSARRPPSMRTTPLDPDDLVDRAHRSVQYRRVPHAVVVSVAPAPGHATTALAGLSSWRFLVELGVSWSSSAAAVTSTPMITASRTSARAAAVTLARRGPRARRHGLWQPQACVDLLQGLPAASSPPARTSSSWTTPAIAVAALLTAPTDSAQQSVDAGAYRAH